MNTELRKQTKNDFEKDFLNTELRKQTKNDFEKD